MRKFLDLFKFIVKIKISLGAFYRNRQRNKGSWITNSANQLARTLLRLELTDGLLPLHQSNTKFEVLILCKSEDFHFIQVNLQLLNETNWNVGKVNLVVDENIESLENQLGNDYKFELGFYQDEDFEELFSKLYSSIGKFHPSRKSWIKQQLIKTAFVYNSKLPILIIDSDTFIISEKTFVNLDKQILLIGDGFHFPYSRHIKQFLHLEPHPLSFVHHVQLQFPEVVRKLYGSDLEHGLRDWMNSGLARFEFSPISEYQTYGEYLLHNEPERVSLYSHTHLLLDVNSVDNFTELASTLKGMNGDLVTLINKHLRKI
jgi:hypothetical protein